MSSFRKKSWSFMFGLAISIFFAILLSGFIRMADAAERGHSHQEFIDSRYNHNHSYPARGQFIEKLPRDHRVVVYGRSRYYFHGGVWYRPEGRRFVIIAPPIGLIVPFLPPYYATIWLGGIPYYYANEVYYTQTAGGYIIVDPPKGEVSATPPAAGRPPESQIFIYPRQGQSEQKQADDRYECHRFAVSQTGFDPTKMPADLNTDQIAQKRSDYQRASSACLDGRGYTVK
jgi:hypothetical protein